MRYSNRGRFRQQVRFLRRQFLTELRGANDTADRIRLYQHLLDVIAAHRVADRPDRYEPRAQRDAAGVNGSNRIQLMALRSRG